MSIQEKLNNRPRKIIGSKTPNEIIDSELKFVAHNLLKNSNSCCVRALDAAF